MGFIRNYGSGLVLTFGLAAVAVVCGVAAPIVGAPIFGIVLGIILNHAVRLREGVRPGVGFTSKKVLQWAVILLGFGISLDQVWATGVDSIVIILVTLAAALVASMVFGRMLGVSSNLTALIGVGTGICGGSAIAAISPIVRAKDSDIAYSISAVFLFNVVAALLFPVLGHWLGMSQHGFGLWAGTAVNDTSSVVAVGYTYGEEAGSYATVVKLTRTTFIVPIALVFAVLSLRGQGAGDQVLVASAEAGPNSVPSPNNSAAPVSGSKADPAPGGNGGNVRWTRIFPWFIVWFLVAVLINSSGLVGATAAGWLQTISKYMITMALCAIGLSTDFRKIVRAGYRPLLLGLIVWIAVIVSSLAVQYATGQV